MFIISRNICSLSAPSSTDLGDSSLNKPKIICSKQVLLTCYGQWDCRVADTLWLKVAPKHNNEMCIED